jgi:hypothetical protein
VLLIKYICVIKSLRMSLEEYVLSVGGGGERFTEFKILVHKPERKWPLGSPKLRYEDNFKTDLEGKVIQFHGIFVSLGGIHW